MPKVRQFLEHMARRGKKLEMPYGLDKELAEYLYFLCYGLQKSPSIGALVFFGLLCLAPELKGRLPLAARSLKALGKLAVSCEGGPLPEEIIFLVAVEMVRAGYLYHGAWVLCQYDVYAREQDMEQLRSDDVAFDGKRLALVFGEAARGQSAKTGHNQGAVVRRGLVIDVFLAQKEVTVDGKIFPMKQDALRKIWHKTLHNWGLDFAGPPHSIRHSGPSEDLARGRSSIEQVRRRGRWKSMGSVQRYTKSFALTRFRAKVPPHTEARAAEISRDLRKALVSALQDHRKSAFGRQLLQSLRAHRGQDNFADADPIMAEAAKKKESRKKKRNKKQHDDTDDDADISSDSVGWATD